MTLTGPCALVSRPRPCRIAGPSTGYDLFAAEPRHILRSVDVPRADAGRDVRLVW